MEVEVLEISFHFSLNVSVYQGKVSCRDLMTGQAHHCKINTVNNFLFLHSYLPAVT